MNRTIPSQALVVIIGGGVTGCSLAYHLAILTVGLFALDMLQQAAWRF